MGAAVNLRICLEEGQGFRLDLFPVVPWDSACGICKYSIKPNTAKLHTANKRPT